MKESCPKPLPADIVRADELWALKRQAQERDRILVASDTIEPEAIFFLNPAQLAGMRIEWPSSLEDSPDSDASTNIV
jgi:hypothetical protein